MTENGRKSAGKTLEAGVRSWKTTAASVIASATILMQSLQFAWDNDPSTTVDSDAMLKAVAAMAVLAWGLMSRDADLSSQDSGVR